MSGDQQDGAFNHFNDLNFSQSFIDLNSMYQQQHPITTYSDVPSQYYQAPHLVVNAPGSTVRHSAPRYTPSASPSTSISHSADQPSSIISSTSNASVPSNASSAVGSPYIQGAPALIGQEQWTKPTSGLGLEHEFVQDMRYHADIFSYATSTESAPSLYSTDRNFGTCVGESQQVSSSLSSSSVPVLSPSLSASTGYSSVYTASPSPSLARENVMNSRNETTGAIPEEYVERASQPFFAQPPTLESHSVETFQNLVQEYSLEKNSEVTDPSFRQPSTPASATSPTVRRRVSPFGARKAPARAQSRAGPDRSTTKKTTPLHHPYERRAAPTMPEVPGQRSFYQAPFFSQSSGRFVAPLESTCWFSLICVVVFFTQHHLSTFQPFISSFKAQGDMFLTAVCRSFSDPSIPRKPHSIKYAFIAILCSAPNCSRIHSSISSPLGLESGLVSYRSSKASSSS